jgi:hypothetical protein
MIPNLIFLSFVSGFNYLAYKEPPFKSLNCENAPFSIYDPTRLLNGCDSCPLKQYNASGGMKLVSIL